MAKKNKDMEIIIKLLSEGNFDEAVKQTDRLKKAQEDAAKSQGSITKALSNAWKSWTSLAETSAGAMRKAWLTALGPLSAVIIVIQTLKSMFGFIFTAVSNFRKGQEEANKTVREASELLNKATSHMQKYADASSSENLEKALRAHISDLDAISKKKDEINEKVKAEGIEWSLLIPFVKGTKDALAGSAAQLAQMEIDLKREIYARQEALELAKKQEESEKKRLSAVESVTQRIKELTLGETDLKLYNLDRQIKKYEEAGVSAVEIERLRALETEKINADADAKIQQEADKKAQALEQIELDLNQKMASLGDDKLQAKLAQNAAEEQAEIRKLNKLGTTNANYEATLAKIKAFYRAKDKKDTEADAKTKQETVYKTLETSLNAISILNDMESGHTKAQAVRAKIILALEKAIAIARIWSAPSLGAWDVGLKVAQTAVVAAQFASQSKAIDSARDAANSADSTSLSTTTDLGDGTFTTETSTSGSSASSSGGSSSSSGSSSSAGGGEVTYINLGGINISLSVESLDISNTRQALRIFAEELRRASVEAISFARSSSALAEKNAGVAV